MTKFKRKNTLMQRYTKFNKIFFQIYRAIPFIFELSTFIDWTVTSTTLSLIEWIRFEDIHAKLYLAKCDSIEFAEKKIGEIVSKITKFMLGCCGILFLLILLFGPMLLFSTLNPMAQSNLVTGASVSFGIVLNKTNYFQLFSNSYVMDIQIVNEDEFNRLYSSINYFLSIDRNSFQVKK